MISSINNSSDLAKISVNKKVISKIENRDSFNDKLNKSIEIVEKSSSKKEKVTTMTVVKVARDKQDMRFDLPITGKGTLTMMKRAGVKVLAIESGKTIILDMEDFIERANKNALVVVAI